MTFDVKKVRAEAERMVDHGDEWISGFAQDLVRACDALDAAAPVVWATTGLDRVHVATGTVWVAEGHRGRFIRQLMSEMILVCRHGNLMCAVGRQDAAQEWAWMMNPDEDGDHRTHLIQHGTAPDEAEAMLAALDAAGWKRDGGG